VQAVFDRTMTEFGRLDILVNCAAVIGRGDFFSFDDVKWAKLFDDKAQRNSRCIRPCGAADASAPLGGASSTCSGRGAPAAAAAVPVGLNNAAIST